MFGPTLQRQSAVTTQTVKPRTMPLKFLDWPDKMAVNGLVLMHLCECFLCRNFYGQEPLLLLSSL